MSHTATPWKVLPGVEDGSAVCYDADGNRVLSGFEDGSWPAESEDFLLAIHCVNTHEALVEALERLLAVFTTCRVMACKEPMMANPLVTEIQTAGGAVVAAVDALAKARQ